MLKDELSKRPPIGRLKRRADFLRVAAARRKWAAPGLVIQVSTQPSSTMDIPVEPRIRVGFTASRRVGNAVKRNRAKRRLKAIAAEILLERALPGFDLVLIARPATVECPFAELRRDLIQGLKRVKVANADADREAR